ncbi:hypothetical protein [Paracidovorax valerianellae]|uniref:hypothetical protein n=1 Tax=Paracidovorax valerianellae TaxID=187868 RepID=UPI0011133E9A|nr:hypothetical protein [Paracidovorax valerianellae]MDA8447887.1 hypothetical protein [Paracidovorax valerianellae]
MFHEPPKHSLYSAYKADVEFQDDCGTKKTCTATAFILEVAKATPWIVTNRHVIDLNYKNSSAKYKNFKPVKFSMTGRRADDSVYTLILHKDAKFFTHDDEENDVALIEAKINPNENTGFHWHFGIEHLATEEILKTVEPFDLVCYAGFPQ